MNIPAQVIQFHAAMLNDKARTSSYLASIRRVVRPGDIVVDIGTGTGIYAMAAALAGAQKVYAIEAGRIAWIARRLIEVNGLADRITLIRGLSTQIWLPERANVLISELIGDEPLAEQVIEITQDALRRLLKPGASLVPSGVKIFGLPVTIPDAELGKLTFAQGTVQNWRSWYGIEFAPLINISQIFPSNFASSILLTHTPRETGKFLALRCRSPMWTYGHGEVPGSVQPKPLLQRSQVSSMGSSYISNCRTARAPFFQHIPGSSMKPIIGIAQLESSPRR